jgi:MFS family permease
MKQPLPVIVLSQFLCTSLWFAGNAILPDLTQSMDLPSAALSHITGAVQLGFIVGTLLFALLSFADRFSPSRLFFISAIMGAMANAGLLLPGLGFEGVLGARMITGFFLAGIYPVGMKIAADYFEKGLGLSLGWLVGALVLGTALPHLIRSFSFGVDGRQVVLITSALAAMGGMLLVILVPDGPFRKSSQKVDVRAFFHVFHHREFRKAALGYFGHMWELYTFWAFVPLLVAAHAEKPDLGVEHIARYAFWIIASGSLACVLAGKLSLIQGPRKVALYALSLSGTCCLFLPIALQFLPFSAFVGYLVMWGMAVVADSPMFSTLVAAHAPPDRRGTALTLVNGLGFALTIVSVQSMILPAMAGWDFPYWFLWLVPGPVVGILALRRLA